MGVGSMSERPSHPRHTLLTSISSLYPTMELTSYDCRFVAEMSLLKSFTKVDIVRSKHSLLQCVGLPPKQFEEDFLVIQFLQ